MILSIFILPVLPVWAATPLNLLQQRIAVRDISENDVSTMESAEALAFVQDMAEKVAGHNYTLTESESNAISTIKDFVDQLLSDIEKQFDEDQAEVNGYKTTIQGCADAAAYSLTKVDDLKYAVHVVRGEHSTCRKSEVDLKDDSTLACQEYDTYRKTHADRVPPACMSTLTKDDVGSDVPATKGGMEECLEKINNWFPPLWEKYQGCKKSKGVLDNKTEVCESKQTVFESDFCQYSLLLTSTCTTQDDCYVRDVDTRDKGHAAVKIAEAARITDCEVGHKIKCLLDIFLEQNNTKKPDMLTNCKALVPSCPYSITYPAIPPKTTCTVEAHEPCDTEWLAAEYTSKSWYSKAPTGPCTECLQPVVATTTTKTTTTTTSEPPPSTPIDYTIVHRPPQHSHGWQIEYIQDSRDHGWLSTHSHYDKYKHGGEPSFWFSIDLGAVKHVTKLTIKNCAKGYQCKDYGITDLMVKGSLTTDFSQSDPVTLQLIQRMNPTQDHTVNIVGRYLYFRAMTYGGNSAALAYLKVSGYAV